MKLEFVDIAVALLLIDIAIALAKCALDEDIFKVSATGFATTIATSA